MIINAATGSKVSKLLSKTVGHSIKGGSKVSGEQGLSILAPANTRIYDVVSGIGAKGKYQTFSFKDESGNVLQHYTRYFKGDNEYTDVIIDTEKSSGIINKVRRTISGFLNGRSSIEKVEHISIMPLINSADNKSTFKKIFMTMTPKGDFGGQEILRQGKKAVGFKHNYAWNGEPINIEYKNTSGQKLGITEAEAQYLPFLHRRPCYVEQNGQQILTSQDFTTGRVKKKIRLAQIIQEKVHGIKRGLLPKAKAVKQDDLVSVKVTGKTAEQLAKERGICVYGEALPSGQINIATDTQNGTDGLYILNRMAHEAQHEADYVAMNKGGMDAALEALSELDQTYIEASSKRAPDRKYYDSSAFYLKCADQNGIFPKGTPEYDEAVKLYKINLGLTDMRNLTNKAAHDAMSFEQRAINREQEQLNVCMQIYAKIITFLDKCHS